MHSAILLSGGLDSTALAYWKKPKHAFTINYGQASAKTEIRVSKKICELLFIKHHIIEIDCSSLGSGDLLLTSPIDTAPSSEWWPYRNQLLVTLSAMKAITMGINELMIGSVISDKFHKDGTSLFYNKLNDLINFQEGELKISAPAINMSSAELIKISGIPSSILFYGHSCHKGNSPCGNCRGCFKYIEVIKILKNEGWE
ncbi:MAG: 7-cyano-7-deazaguanine synthase [Candidatus Pacearchaeota archaeon]